MERENFMDLFLRTSCCKCRYHYEGEHRFNSSELQLLHFLERTRQPGWKWIDMKQRSQPPEYSAASSSHTSHRKSRSLIIYLLLYLLFIFTIASIKILLAILKLIALKFFLYDS